jgi:NTP pyrophosphatase (non-canonical NTP hydrolase)
MDFSEISARALTIRRRLEEYEQRKFGRTWSREELALGLVGDVGDLATLIQALEGVREIDGIHERLEHELADVLWSALVLANECQVDLEAGFVRTMDAIERNLAS